MLQARNSRTVGCLTCGALTWHADPEFKEVFSPSAPQVRQPTVHFFSLTLSLKAASTAAGQVLDE